MKRSIGAVILVLLGIGLRAQDHPDQLGLHGKCTEDNESVSSPLKGWVGYTNTGKSVSDMIVQALSSPDKRLVATTKTDAAGRFSFPTISIGRYYLKATKELPGATVRADAVVTVKKGKNRIACLVAEAEEANQSPPL